MKQSQAIDLISVPGRSFRTGGIWVDLGCGTGTFTMALARLLGANSRIFAVDKNYSSLEKIPGYFNKTVIEKKHVDFITDELYFPELDGILMANSLHYVQKQTAFIKAVKTYLKPDGCFLIVEYDSNRSNPWVPYPVSFSRLEELFNAAGFSSVQKITEKPSLYNRSNLYSAIIGKQNLV